MGEHQGQDLRWLVLGATAGLIAAGYGLLRVSDAVDGLPEHAVARVNEQLIGRDEYVRAMQRLGRDSEEDKLWLLQRLVDDELLVQRGIELGLAESDTAVRNAIVNSIVASVTAEADAADPSDAELERHLTTHAARFSFTAELDVDVWQTDDEALAQAFAAGLRDGSGPILRDGIEALPALPPELMPIEVLRDYVGPGVAAAAAEMPDGSSAVFARRGRWLVLRVNAKTSRAVDELDSIRNRVLLDYRRTLANDALAAYVDGLRERAKVVVSRP